MNVEQTLAGSSLPYLCFPCNVLSPPSIPSASSCWPAKEAKLFIRKALLLAWMTAACGFHAGDGSSVPHGVCAYICESIIHFTCHFFSLLGVFPCHYDDRRVDLRVPSSAECLAEIQNCWEIECRHVRSILEGTSALIQGMLYLCCCLPSCFSAFLWLLAKVWRMHILVFVLLPKSNWPTGLKIMVPSKILIQQYNGGMRGRRRK